MIVRLIVLTLLVWLGFRVYKILQKKSSDTASKAIIQDMVSCEKCGMHIPIDEALKANNKYYCSHDHLDEKS